MTLTRLIEITFSEAPQVDRDAGVIRGVKILGRTSRNGREYTDQALRQAARLYEGMAVNLNHPEGAEPRTGRAVEEAFGWLEGIEVTPEGVFGDLHYLRAHPQAGPITEAALRNPRRFGLSHNARGRVARRDGTCVVESIEAVHSVDVVQNPATSRGLFESENKPVEQTVHQILETAGGRPAQLLKDERLCELARATVAVPESAAAADAVAAALVTLVESIVQDAQLDGVARRQHILAVLEALPRTPVEPAGDRPAPSPDAEGVGSMAELVGRIEKLETESRCRGLLESARRECDSARLAALVGLSTNEERMQLIESWPERALLCDRPRPAVSRPLREAATEAIHFPEDARSFAAAIR